MLELIQTFAFSQMDMTATQKRLLNDYQMKFTDTKQNKIAAIVREKLDAIENATTSMPLQKVRLIDANAPCASKTVIMSIWKPNESYTALRENTFLDMRYVTANGMRGKDVQIFAGNLTQLREIQSAASTAHEAFVRRLIPLASIDPQQFKPPFNEFDTIGFVLKVEDPLPNQFQSVFIVDAERNIFCIKFWGSIQNYAYDDIVQVNKFVMINQLDWRPNNRLNRHCIPQAFVTETTTFSESPKSHERSAALNGLRAQFDRFDLSEYAEICCQKIEDAQANKENSSMNHSSRESTWSKPVDSSLNQSMLNRTTPGLSTGGQILGIKEKIDRLRNVGSPPAFRSSYLNSTRTPEVARKPFKNPIKK